MLGQSDQACYQHLVTCLVEVASKVKMNGTDFCETEWEGTAKTDKLIRQLFGEIPIKDGVKKKKRKHEDIGIQSPKRKKVSALQQSEKHPDETLRHKPKSQDDKQVTTKAMFVKKTKNKKKSKNEAVGNGEMNVVTSVLNEKGNKSVLNEKGNKKKSDKNKYKHSAVKNNDNDYGSQTGKAKNNLTKDKLNLKTKDTSEYENVNKKGRKKEKVTSSQSREENSAISKDPKGNNLKRKSKQNLEVNTGDMPSKPKKSKNKYLHLAISAKQDKGTTPEDTPVSLLKKKKHRRAKKKKLASNKASKISSTSPGKSTKQQSTIIAEDNVYENHKRTVTTPTKKSNKQPTSSSTKSPFDITKLQSLLDKSVKNDIHTLSKHEKLELQDKQDKKKQNDEDREPQNLKERMLQKLKSARFRHLNEQLYTISGSEAYKLFQKDPEAFQVYHKGFQTQVIKWPENPLDRMVAYINQRPKTEVVADFGCGDAELSSRLPHKVHSFDLIAVNPRVTACDMADVPLRSGSVDVGVFCLSLMGTNLVEYLIEAHRVLKQRGTLLIAEVLSRFEKVGIFVRKMQKLGFILLEKDTSNKMFVWFEFQKAANYDKDMLPHIELQPCVYKKR